MVNEVVEVWQDFNSLRAHLNIVVVSDDGWCWLLAWDQIGVDEVFCCPLTETAQEQLDKIAPRLSCKLRIWNSKLSNLYHPTRKTLVNIHFENLSTLNLFEHCVLDLRTPQQEEMVTWMITVAGTQATQTKVKLFFSEAVCWQTVRHTKLGGLTSARLIVGCSGTRSGTLGALTRPKRPFHRFLDPATKNTLRRKPRSEQNDCWYPHADAALPLPWPWRKSPIWVETTSVYTKDFIQRHFTNKEKCQLMDLHHKWSEHVEMIRSWNDYASPPLRMIIEVIVDMRKALWPFDETERNKDEIKSPDWGRLRAPWLGISDAVTGDTPIERMLYFGWVWDPKEAMEIAVACRGDDAEIDFSLWAVGGNAEGLEEARQKIRDTLWKIWMRSICREGRTWIAAQQQTTDERQKSLTALDDCLIRCHSSTWWTWDLGSRLFFWRWPEVWRKEARDGAMGFHTSFPRPRLHFPQVPIQEDWIKEKDMEKLEKLLRRGYIHNGECRTTVPRFPVPKGDDDIRVVWDLSKNGMNATMYTPTFFLASMSTYIRRIETGFYGGDFDVGEQFHNYILHEGEQPYCGVEIPVSLREKLNSEGYDIRRYMRWSRLVFGWQSSPYLALRMFARALEYAKGDPNQSDNVFGWKRVQLNLPGMSDYDPGRPRVMKIAEDGSVACDCVTFYDDGRVFGSTQAKAEKAIRQITSRLQYLGNQDAARKRRAVSQTPGAWAGGVAYADQNILRVFIAQKKWDRVKEFLTWVENGLDSPDQRLDRKLFQSGKGFLVHVSLCYDFVQPYLKGFHLSENSWRGDRDIDGWKVNQPNDFGELPDGDRGLVEDTNEPPYIEPVPRLRDDVSALQMFFKHPTPVQFIVRPVQGSCLVAYGGGDASGEGFGGQIQPRDGRAIIRRGFWCPIKADESSNWRELRNLIDLIQIEASRGSLAGKEVWLATDNTTAAFAFYNGSSTSRSLHEMVIELRLIALRGNFILHVYHIAGTRMIASGIDGLSRGELHVDALERCIPLIMPLHLSPCQRSPTLFPWLQSWLDSSVTLAQPKDWFHAAQQAGEYTLPSESITWIWDLPPAAAIHALEELGNGRLKRHNILRGVVIIPHLLTYEWSRRFAKIVDCYFNIPPGSIPEWPDNMHEPLTIGLYLPLFRHEPWDWKQVPFMAPMGSALSAMYKARDPSTRDILRQFWSKGIGVTSMPKGVVRNLLQSRSWKRFLNIQTK